MYLTIKEVAARLRVSRSTINRLLRAGELGKVKAGTHPRSRVRIPEDSLVAFISRQTNGSTSSSPQGTR